MGAAEGIQIDEPEDVEVLTALMPPTSEVPDISGTQLLVLDFDGVLTDNLVYVSEEGVESVVCNRSDGWGIARLIEAGINVVVISTEVNPVVEVRCRKLRAECLQGVDDKASALRIELARRNIDSKDVVYVGNDLNDLTAMELVGTGVAVADAHPKVLAMSSFVTKARGGGGAVREICDLILSQRN
jgi:YrbI family 3-deoxy-D-manno-octulosonate 8-phosphate phosphatase